MQCAVFSTVCTMTRWMLVHLFVPQDYLDHLNHICIRYGHNSGHENASTSGKTVFIKAHLKILILSYKTPFCGEMKTNHNKP